jgi:hypothetical protein
VSALSITGSSVLIFRGVDSMPDPHTGLHSGHD